MPEYSDIYIISDKREKSTIIEFLNHFMHSFVESADEYEIPQYSNKIEISFNTAVEVIEYCVKNKNSEYSLYWRNKEGKNPEHGMAFYLNDGNVIYGLSTDASDQTYAKSMLNEMKKYFNTRLGYIAHEASPDANNISEFKLQIEKHKAP